MGNMMYRDLEGFDSNTSYSDDKEVERFKKRIWKVAIVLSVILLAIFIRGHVREMNLINNGQTIEAEYYKNGVAVYKEAGFYSDYQVGGTNKYHEGDKITLYYMNDMKAAKVPEKSSTFIMAYVLFGSIVVLSIYRLRAIAVEMSKRRADKS